MSARSRRRSPGLLLACGVALLAPLAPAEEARVRVRGSARIEANVRPSERGTELEGTLSDDTGRPVGSAKVEVRWTAPSGSALVLPSHEPCSSVGAARRETRGYSGPSAEIAIETDARGRFCVRFPLELPDGKLLVGYVDARGLLDTANASVNLTPRSDFELRFAPPPQTLSADREEATLELEARARPGRSPSGPAPVVISYHPDDAPETVLGHREMSAGELLRFSFPTRELRAPGAGELRAVLGKGERTAETRARVVTTATARLVAARQLEADANGHAELAVKLESRIATVASGSVEALSAGRTVGIAPVVAGEAKLTLRLGAGERQVPVTLRYLPSTPWWIAGPETPLLVQVVAPNPLRRAPWALGLLAIGIWIGLSWRRPRSAERPTVERAPAAQPPKPSLAWFPAPESARGWSGRVVDAHDGSPLAGAQIEIVTRFGSATARTDEQGAFSIDTEPDLLEGKISISSRFHASFTRALPPPGRLGVALVTRRRALLAELVEFATRARVGRGAEPAAAAEEPTPGEVARQAAESSRGDVATWAKAVEGAAFGPDPVDAERESAVRALEPADV